MSDAPITLPVLQALLEDIKATQSRIETTLDKAVERIEQQIENRHASISDRVTDLATRLGVLEYDKTRLKDGWKLLWSAASVAASVVVFVTTILWMILSNWDATLRARQAFDSPDVVIVPPSK